MKKIILAPLKLLLFSIFVVLELVAFPVFFIIGAINLNVEDSVEDWLEVFNYLFAYIWSL